MQFDKRFLAQTQLTPHTIWHLFMRTDLQGTMLVLLSWREIFSSLVTKVAATATQTPKKQHIFLFSRVCVRLLLGHEH